MSTYKTNVAKEPKGPFFKKTVHPLGNLKTKSGSAPEVPNKGKGKK